MKPIPSCNGTDCRTERVVVARDVDVAVAVDAAGREVNSVVVDAVGREVDFIVVVVVDKAVWKCDQVVIVIIFVPRIVEAFGKIP